MTKLLAVLGAALAVWGTVLAWKIADPHVGTVPSKAQTVGMCHAFATDVEAINLSDVAPPVPCDEPHQAETFATTTLPANAGRPDGSRPGLEATAALTKGLCTGKELPAHLGADTYDEPAFLNIWTRVPPPADWAAGDRTVRCDAVPAAAAGVLPSMDTSLHGIMRTRRGDRFRKCYDGTTTVPCSVPHTAEHVRSWIPIPSEHAPDRIPGPWAVASCAPLVSEFLGQDVARTPYRIEAFAYPNVVPATAECRLAIPDGSPKLTGSLSKTVRGDAP